MGKCCNLQLTFLHVSDMVETQTSLFQGVMMERVIWHRFEGGKVWGRGEKSKISRNSHAP